MQKDFNKHLDEIARQYMVFPFRDLEKHGLAEGLAGVTVVYCLLSRHTGNVGLKAKSEEAVNRLFEVAAETGSLDFGTGLTGVCWTIEWLKSNGFIDLNTDEVLGEVDNLVYRNLFSKVGKEGISVGEITGLCKYLLSRLTSRNPRTHRYIRLMHQECLLISLDVAMQQVLTCAEFKSFLRNPEAALSPGPLSEICDILLLISKTTEEHLNIPQMEEKLYSLVRLADTMLKKFFSSLGSMQYKSWWGSFAKLVITLYNVGEAENFSTWKNMSAAHLESLLNGIGETGILKTNEYLHILLLSMQCRIKNRSAYDSCVNNTGFASAGHPMHLKNGCGQIVLSLLAGSDIPENKLMDFLLL